MEAPAPASAAGARSKGEVGKQRDQEQKDEPPDSHESSTRDGTRTLGLDPGHGGDGAHDECKSEPNEPVHSRIIARATLQTPAVQGFVARWPQKKEAPLGASRERALERSLSSYARAYVEQVS